MSGEEEYFQGEEEEEQEQDIYDDGTVLRKK